VHPCAFYLVLQTVHRDQVRHYVLDGGVLKEVYMMAEVRLGREDVVILYGSKYVVEKPLWVDYGRKKSKKIGTLCRGSEK
jgi:hypothetical protein